MATITGTNSDDTLTGRILADVIDGKDGNDTIRGKGGADSIRGGAGVDHLFGDGGDDLLVVDATGTAANEVYDGGDGQDTLQVESGADFRECTLTSIEKLRFVSSSPGAPADVLFSAASFGGTGLAGALQITGSSGADHVRILMLDDTSIDLSGVTYVDWGVDDQIIIVGDKSAEIVKGSWATDVIRPGDGTDTVLAGGGDDVRIDGSTGNDSMTGSSVNDVLFGDVGQDVLLGGAGNDTLDGGGGSDFMLGGAGDDIYLVDAAGDVAAEVLVGSDPGGHDLVKAQADATLTGFIEDLELLGGANLNGTGNGLANRIQGNGASNILKGLDGNDRLAGGLGLDHLFGGLGNDRFVFNTTADSVVGSARDQIEDFAGGDKIDVSGIDANETIGGNQAFTLDVDGSFSTGEIWLKISGADTIICFNTDADASTDMQIRVRNVTNLSATNFIL